MVSKYDYSVTPGDRLGRPLAKELAAQFSSAYGKWCRKSPVNPGGRIRLGADYYLKNYGNGLFRIATCRAGTRLIAQAVYLERDTPRGRVSLVVQLVVDAEFRRQGVATTLLHAIWGFSDFYAWGIVTSSPCTVEALEAATFRRCNAGLISRRAAFVAREVLARVPFLASAPWRTDGSSSAVDSKFFTDRSAKPVARRRVERRLGRLAEGEEWLALTFRDQDLDLEDAYSQIVGCSGRFVAEAYRRQPQARQKWAAKAGEEMDNLLRWLPAVGKDTPVCDFGAGTGRHVAELRRRGFEHVEGIDFAATGDGVSHADCRSWKSQRRFGLILCLYDVVGSFADDRANLAILKNIARHLRKGGFAAISVANAGFSGLRGTSVDSKNRRALIKSIFRLEPSRTMATTGEFLSAKSVLRNRSKGLFYHKEQFFGGSGLPGEYLVVDRRYTAGEIEALVEKAGLRVVMRRFVRSGFSKDLSEGDGKEILVIANKVTTRRTKCR